MTRLAPIGCIAALLTLGTAAAASADEITRDMREIRHDKAEMRHDKVELRHERAERNYALKRELRAIENGNLKAARRWDAVRRDEQRDVNAARRELRSDRSELRRDRVELRRDLRREGY